MPPRTNVEALLALLRDQRHEVATRAALERHSPDWEASSRRLDELNDRIMHVSETGSRLERIGAGLDLDLDTRPADDVAFRDSVVSSLRLALTVAARQQVAARSLARLDSAAERIRATELLLHEAVAALNEAYPRATLERRPEEPLRGMIAVRADREGRVA